MFIQLHIIQDSCIYSRIFSNNGLNGFVVAYATERQLRLYNIRSVWVERPYIMHLISTQPQRRCKFTSVSLQSSIIRVRRTYD